MRGKEKDEEHLIIKNKPPLSFSEAKKKKKISIKKSPLKDLIHVMRMLHNE
jgi:hypothetical protein